MSDRCSKGEAVDGSGPSLAAVLTSSNGLQPLSNAQIVRHVVPDEVDAIQRVLRKWCDELRLWLVLTTGGTGLSKRDVTPEATRGLLDKEAPGFVTAMMVNSLKITPMAMLSRSVCGVRNNTLLVNLPGSKKASQECLQFILPVLPHAWDVLSGNLSKVEEVHSKLVSAGCTCQGAAAAVGGLLSVAQRPRHSPYPMLSVEEAQEKILGHAGSKGVRRVSTSDVVGYIVAEAVFSAVPVPPFPASIKDGYAVVAVDGEGERTVLTPVTAGDKCPVVEVRSGSVVRITTGAPLPPGADAVVQVEDTELVRATSDGTEEEVVRIKVAVASGHDVRPVGVDIPQNQLILCEGDRLGPPEIGLLSAVGITEVNVVDLPRVAVLSTGNEIMDATLRLEEGQIFDSNRRTLLAALKEQGIPSLDVGIARDHRDTLREKIASALDQADVLISSGGVSMGEMDLLKPVLKEDFGATVHFGRVYMKPGKPTTFATLERNGVNKMIFALPGNPVSCVVTFYLLVLPALRKMAGWREFKLTQIPVETTFPLVLDSRPEYHRAHVSWQPHAKASSTGAQSSSRLLSMKSANALLVLPPRSETLTQLQTGSTVQAIIIPHTV